MANLKRNMIELVTDVKDGEIVTEKYLTPPFLPFGAVYEAASLRKKMVEFEGDVEDEKKLYDEIFAFIADTVYGKQFSRKELEAGLHAPDAGEVITSQILFVAQGDQSDETKKFLEKKR